VIRLKTSGCTALFYLIAAACAIGTPFSAIAAPGDQPRVQLLDNHLLVDGQPFFFHACWGAPDSNYSLLAQHHFNSVSIRIDGSLAPFREAAGCGLLTIPFALKPDTLLNHLDMVDSLAAEDWVLAWVIGDDLNYGHLASDTLARKAVEDRDLQHRPTTHDAIADYESLSTRTDMWSMYAFPLVRTNLLPLGGSKPGGLSEYGTWLKAMRELGYKDGRRRLFWTSAQAHVQNAYSLKYLGGPGRPTRFPDGDHMRLIAAHAISAGAQGILWFRDKSLEDYYLGADRYARTGIVGCELDVVGPLIAAAESTGARLATSDSTVWATPIYFPGGRLISLIKTGYSYHYQPDRGEVTGLGIYGVSGNLYQVGYDFVPVQHDDVSFFMSSWLLETTDQAIVNQAEARHSAVRDDMAAFAIDELEARIDKVSAVIGKYGASELDSLQIARDWLASAKACPDPACAGTFAEMGLARVRETQHRLWQGAWTPDVLEAGLERMDFYILADSIDAVRCFQADSCWSQDSLCNGAFSNDTCWTGDVVLDENVYRSAPKALLLSSGARESEILEEPAATVLSTAPVPAAPRQCWKVEGWVNIPVPLASTSRGVSITLIAYDAGGGVKLEVSQDGLIDSTGGWTRVEVAHWLNDASITHIRVRLALYGIGEAYLDDFSLRLLDPCSGLAGAPGSESQTPGATAELYAGYPNPSSGITSIRYDVALPGDVSLRIYDARGRLVRVLVEGVREAGTHRASWDGRDDRGRQAGSGVYFCRFIAPGYASSRRIVLVR
jgi:hypothetical protein